MGYFWKLDKKSGYLKIFERIKQKDGTWKQVYRRSCGRAEAHHKKLLRIEANEKARENLKKLVTQQQTE